MIMIYWFRLSLKFLFVESLLFTVTLQQSPVFLVNPVSVAAVDGTTVEFTCTANNTDTIVYRVNDTSATNQIVISKGFTELGSEEVDSLTTRRNLTVTASSLYNNTEIFCAAVGSPMNTDSKIAILIVQGPLSSVGDLSHSFINPSTINISWSPPFTLPGTTITGYNISVTSNGTTTNYFTSDSYYVLQLSDITDSPCNEINVTVSGYNGLDGEINIISRMYFTSVPSSDVELPVTTVISTSRRVLLNVTVIMLCVGERPSTIVVKLVNNSIVVDNVTDIMLPQDTDTNVLTVNTTLTVLEDQRYTAVVSFSNLGGEFSNSSTVDFSTFGVESVVITDTTGGRVCLECSFSSFSTDTGCTVELVLSGSVKYRDTFNRRGNTAKGCVSGVAAGEYVVRVYDQSSSELVHEVDNVTVSMIQVLPTSATTAIMSFSSDSLSTTDSSPTLEPPSDKDKPDTPVIIGVIISVILLFLVILIVAIICVILWMKKNDQKQPQTWLKAKNPEKFEPEYAVPEDKPSKCAADLKIQHTGVYADIHVEKGYNPLPRISDDKKVTYSQPLFEKMDRPPDIDNNHLSKPTRQDDTKLDEQDFNEKDVEVLFQKTCVDSDEEEVPPVPPRSKDWMEATRM